MRSIRHRFPGAMDGRSQGGRRAGRRERRGADLVSGGGGGLWRGRRYFIGGGGMSVPMTAEFILDDKFYGSMEA